MKVYPHVLLKRGDVIIMPWSWTNVVVVWLIDGHLLVEDNNNRFCLPRGFYFIDDEQKFTPIFW